MVIESISWSGISFQSYLSLILTKGLYTTCGHSICFQSYLSLILTYQRWHGIYYCASFQSYLSLILTILLVLLVIL